MIRATIVIVEDDAILRELISEVVAEMGHAVLPAQNADRALALLQSDRVIDMMITDVNMPGEMDGCMLADHARTKRADLKVLFITGHSDYEPLRALPAYPLTAVLRKPFWIRELSRIIDSMIGNSDPARIHTDPGRT